MSLSATDAQQAHNLQGKARIFLFSGSREISGQT